MLGTLKQLLLKIIDDIDAGNSTLDEIETTRLIKALRTYTRRDGYWSKYQAYTYLNISRSKFDKMVREGKLPEGKKVPGFKELFWVEKEIRKIAKQ